MLARMANCFLLLSTTFLLTTGCGSGEVKIPKSYSTYNAKDGTFACDAPDGWEVKGGGKGTAPVWAKFSSGPALIHFEASGTNRLANASLSGRGADANAVVELAPVHLLHIDMIELVKEDYEGYAEEPGSPLEMECTLGPARLSEFTYQTSFGSNMRGYRVSIIGHKRGITAFCTCPDSDWKALKPVFDQVLASLERGSAE